MFSQEELEQVYGPVEAAVDTGQAWVEQDVSDLRCLRGYDRFLQVRLPNAMMIGMGWSGSTATSFHALTPCCGALIRYQTLECAQCYRRVGTGLKSLQILVSAFSPAAFRGVESYCQWYFDLDPFRTAAAAVDLQADLMELHRRRDTIYEQVIEYGYRH